MSHKLRQIVKSKELHALKNGLLGVAIIYFTPFIAPVFSAPLPSFASSTADSIVTPSRMYSTKDFVNADGSVSFRYDSSLESSPKLLKTHDEEVFYKSAAIRGFSFGYTIDKVRNVDTIEDFIMPEKLLRNVVETEREKEGVISCEGISASKSSKSVAPNNDIFIPAYDLEYITQSTRGTNRYFVKTAIANKKLYVATVQVSENSLDKDVRIAAMDILNSFSIRIAR